MEISEYYPFKSPELRDQYLKAYDQMAEGWPVPSENKLVDTSYGKTFVRISGRAGAKPLVLLHGAAGSSLYWRKNVGALSEHFRIYAIDDLHGSGRSINAPGFLTSDDRVTWLNCLFDALNLGKSICLIGHSFGGWQVSQYALRFSERLDKTVILCPGYTVLPVQAKALARFVPAILIPSRFFSRRLILWLYEDLVKKDRAAVEAFIQILLLASRCFKTRRLTRMTVLSDSNWKSLTIPTLFLVGENEKIYSAHAAVKRLNTVAPQIKTGIIPNAGHDLLLVQTDLVNRKVLEFLTGAGTSAYPAQISTTEDI
jgi:pimeloyl-ACP methyl ester carboxylesterase